ncbi:MAG: hypothetical protein WDZ33_00040 [Balneolaceae bacterium]
MYNDLADAVEDLKSKGIENLSGLPDDELEEHLSEMDIVTTYRFDSGTDPSDESTLYLLKRGNGNQCFLVMGFGIYKDPEKARIVDLIEELENNK